MTSLLDRFTGPADLEDTPVTNPPPSFASPRGIPWWAGVYGLDPALPVGDWATAARYTGLACAVRVCGIDAVYRTALFSRKGKPAARMQSWLLKAVEPEGAARRRFALRLAVEHAAHLEVDDLLVVAGDLCDALTPA